MTDESNFCVDSSHKHGPKRCNSCGKPVKAQSAQPEVQVSPESLAKFKSFIEDMISDGEDPLDDMDSLYEAAEDLGVPKQIAAQVIVELSSGSNEDNLELKLFYDTSVANMGVANGNSILSLRLENSSPKSFEKILIEFKHPEEQTPVIFEPVKSLGKGKTKQVETSLKLNLVGQHSIKDGEIRIFALNGSVQVFRLASSIRMSAENSQVSKNTSNVTNVRNETHGGGVIDASRFGGGGTSGSAQLDVWEFVRLKKVNAKDQGTMEALSESKSAPERVAEPIAPVAEPVVAAAPPQAEVIQAAPVEVIAKAVEVTEKPMAQPKSTTMGSLDPGEDDFGGFREILETEFEDADSLERLKIELLDEFVRLTALMSFGQPNKLSMLYKPVDIDFPLLKAVAAAASIKMSDVLSIATAGSGGSDLKSISGAATVVTRDGLLIFEGQGAKVDLKVTYSWVFLDENDWGVFSQDFGSGYYIAMIGDEATDVALPGLTFDLRKNEDPKGASRLFAFAEERYSQLMRTVSSIENFYEEDEEDDDTDSSEVAYKYRVEMSGVGSEMALGTIPRSTYDYFKANQIDVADYIADSDSYSHIPQEHQFAQDGAWFDVNNLIHESGVVLDDACILTVTDEDGDIWSTSLDEAKLVAQGITINCLGEIYICEQPDGTVVFMGETSEKGTFFAADLILEEPFDATKLCINYSDVDGSFLSSSISYDNVELDNEGSDTIGQGNFYKFTLVGEEELSAAPAIIQELDEEEEEEIEEEDELANAARSFFAMYAFVTQYCDETAERPIHLYMEEDDGGEVSMALADQLMPLFPNDRLLAICEDDPQSGHGSNGELTSWNGLATIISSSGLYHVKSNGHGAYELDGKTAFLSWAKLFGDCKAGLVIRSDVPDIWVGTSDTYLIKSSYVDYSASISTWIYFDEFVKPELLERFSAFKQLALSRT
jgi:hypothetical protein